MKLNDTNIDHWLDLWARASIRGMDEDAADYVIPEGQLAARGELVAYARIFLDLADGDQREYQRTYLAERDALIERIRDSYLAELAQAAERRAAIANT